MDEHQIIAAVLFMHRYDGETGGCDCGRPLARGYDAHAAEEIVLALREASMGVFLYERIGLHEEDR